MKFLRNLNDAANIQEYLFYLYFFLFIIPFIQPHSQAPQIGSVMWAMRQVAPRCGRNGIKKILPIFLSFPIRFPFLLLQLQISFPSWTIYFHASLELHLPLCSSCCLCLLKDKKTKELSKRNFSSAYSFVPTDMRTSSAEILHRSRRPLAVCEQILFYISRSLDGWEATREDANYWPPERLNDSWRFHHFEPLTSFP